MAAARTSRRRRGVRLGPRCSVCGVVPANPLARAEVAMLWLLPGATSRGPVERWFCRDCAPVCAVDELVCVRCGDGPLLAGALAAGDEAATVVVREWMSAVGWRLSGPVCPDCVGEFAR